MVYFFVGLGGIAGSLLRYFLSALAGHIWGKEFPIGTLIINLTGSLLLGFVTARLVTPKRLKPELLTALTTGVIGSYTTFSTFCLELFRLMETGHHFFAFVYMFISFIGGLIFVRLGLMLGEQEKLKAGKR